MQKTLRRMQARRTAGDQGFTLIELLVVVVIIGVLVGISVPLYMNYTKGAKNASAQSDVRGAIAAVEQYYTENDNKYPASATSEAGKDLTLTALTGGTNQTVTVSPENKVAITNKTTSYVICGQNGTDGKIYVYNNAKGGSVKPSSQGTLELCATNGD